jgi:hypothetical protein
MNVNEIASVENKIENQFVHQTLYIQIGQLVEECIKQLKIK